MIPIEIYTPVIERAFAATCHPPNLISAKRATRQYLLRVPNVLSACGVPQLITIGGKFPPGGTIVWFLPLFINADTGYGAPATQPREAHELAEHCFPANGCDRENVELSAASLVAADGVLLS